jgi:hypothetical protein
MEILFPRSAWEHQFLPLRGCLSVRTQSVPDVRSHAERGNEETAGRACPTSGRFGGQVPQEAFQMLRADRVL